MATTTKKKIVIRPIKRASASTKAKMKRSFDKWKRSAAGRKYERVMSNPATKRRHYQERILKIKGWIAKLRTSKDPLKVRKIYNHNLRIKSLQESIKKIK